MCGIAGIIYRNGDGHEQVGRDMTRMLQAMKHRGPDSTGYALYRPEAEGYVMHVKLVGVQRAPTSSSPSACSRQRGRDRGPPARGRGPRPHGRRQRASTP